MRRREFLGLVGNAAAWPMVARAQQPKAMRRIGVLTGGFGPDSQARLEAFLKALAQLRWTDGQNVRLEIRRGGGDADAIRRYATELAALAPDVIMAVGGTATGALLQATRSVPIVFAIVPDPIGSGFVASLSRPGGNATGFLQFEYGLSGKWLELLKEIRPGLTRVAVLRDSTVPAGIGQLAVIQSLATTLDVDLSPIDAQNAAQIERDITAFARSSDGGLIVASSTGALVNRALIVALAARFKLPALYAQREFVTGGGLMSYSADFSVQFHDAAGYVDRILKGDKPADLPVQAPTRYELVINLKTAKALGLDVPPTGQGLGESQSQRSRFPQTRFHPPHVTKAMQSLIKTPDGLLASAFVTVWRSWILSGSSPAKVTIMSNVVSSASSRSVPTPPWSKPTSSTRRTPGY